MNLRDSFDARARAPGRQRPEAVGLRQAAASPQGLAASGLSLKAGPHPLGGWFAVPGEPGEP
jgi:hypothetical protein